MASEMSDETISFSMPCEKVAIETELATVKDDDSAMEPCTNDTQNNAQTANTSNGDSTVDGAGELSCPHSSIPETVEFKVVYNKTNYDVTFPLDETVDSLKQHIERLTEVPVAMQKIMFKGRMNDEQTLRQHRVVKGSKIMVVGSKVNDVMSVNEPGLKPTKDGPKLDSPTTKEPLTKQKPHKTVLEKHGKPDDAMPGIKNSKDPLPPVPISGMYNKSGGRVRLTFKLEAQQLWLGTKERTEKIAFSSIKAVVSEPMDGHEEYHLMGIQLGPTEASRYWIYWVPAQFVDAIKDTLLGNWQYF